jgi:hypothetical protein
LERFASSVEVASGHAKRLMWWPLLYPWIDKM